MKKLITNFKNGKVEIIETPLPKISENELLIKSLYSAVSYGTENYLVRFGESNLVSKILNNKDKVHNVIRKISNEGFKTTYNAISNKFDSPVPLGYSNLGIVVETGSNVKEFSIGDKVISNGSHAEFNSVSENLCSLIKANNKVKNGDKDRDYCFTVIGSIALHSVRLSNCTIGENVVVIGLGLIGISTVQILKASGCNVIGVDIDEGKEEIAKILDIDFVHINKNDYKKIKFLNKNLIDRVIITSSSNDSSAIDLASEIIRKKGKIVLVGIADIKINRDIFYKKEIDFVVSSSYGPGRYDPYYEKKNIDYPINYVRWTAKRNFETVIELINSNKLTYKPFIKYEDNLQNSTKIYDYFKKNKIIAAIICYDYLNNNDSNINQNKVIKNKYFQEKKNTDDQLTVSFIGSGKYASSNLMPIFKKNKSKMVYVMSKNGLSSNKNLQKFNFKYNTTDFNEILNSNETNTVVICNQHNLHATQVIDALNFKKNIYCEKPLALNYNELNEIRNSYINSNCILKVGFNRRYSNLVKKIIDLLKFDHSEKSFNYVINAGKIDNGSWLGEVDISGGRIIGEICHFIDLIKFITKSRISKYNITRSNNENDNCVINLKFTCGSIASISYFVDGSNQHSKENLSIYSNDKVLVLDNFKILKGYGFKNFNKIKLWNQDKGHENCITDFINSINNNYYNIDEVDNYIETSKICIDLANNKNVN